MPDIVTTRIFADGEKNITAAKLNDIIGSSVIQTSFVGGKPVASSIGSTDNLLLLTAGGTYAQVPFSTLSSAISGSIGDAEIWSVRLRSFNSIGNPNFEVDQRTVGVGPSGPNAFAIDRWYYAKTGTMTMSLDAQVDSSATPVLVPGTSFAISQNFFRFTLATVQASLGATDKLALWQYVEGPQLRELIGDVHSLSVLVRTSVAGLKFGLTLQDPTSTHTLTKLATIASANTWTLLTFPALPVWTPDRKSTRLNSSHSGESRMPSSA